MVRSLEEKLEFKKKLEERTSVFTVSVFRCLDTLPKIPSSKVITFQLGKSASSVGANYREATRAESRDDFGHKLQIALKESAETCYWLEILVDLHPMHGVVKDLLSEAYELRNMLQSMSLKTRRKNLKTSIPQNLKN